MKVKCKTKSYKILSEDYLKDIFTVPEDFSLIEGKEYVVYGLLFQKNLIFYLISDEVWGGLYPSWTPAPLFEISKNNMSAHWQLAQHKNHEKTWTFVIFKEWAEDDFFYDGLVDGEEKEKKIWLSVKKKLDLEFEN